MRKLTAFLTGILILLFCVGCNNANTDMPENTDSTDNSLSYKIKTVADTTMCGSNEITYPELVSQTAHFDAVNLLIRQQLRERLEKHISEDFSNTTVNLHYSITLSNENLLCLLYEGNFYTESAAHPSNIAFSICIDLKSEKAVLPTELFQLDTAFLQQFRTQLKTGAHPYRFTKDQWEEVASYITAFTNGEIFETLQRNPQSTLAIYKGSVAVLFPVSSAIGDYIKIDVPNSITANIETVEQGTYWRVMQSEKLYYYEIINASGTVAKAEGPSNKMPRFLLIEDRFVKCTTQAGTGISTQSGFYYDIENGVFSDIFPSIWDE